MDENDIELELADEEYMEFRRRVIAVILCAVLIVLIGVGVVFAYLIQRNEDNEIRKSADEYNSLIRPLLEEEAEIRGELAELRLNTTEKTADNYGSVVLLCIEPGKWILEDIKPICDLYGYKCTVAVSENGYPGKDGFLSVAELKELIDDGWELCISVQNTSQAEKIAEMLQNDGFDQPDSIYLPSGNGSDSIDDFARYGYSNVVTHTDEKGEMVWTAEVTGCRESGIKDYISNAVDSCECIVVSFGTLYTREAYSSELLSNLMGNIGSYVINGKTEVTSIAKARERRMEFENVVGDSERSRVERESELNKRLYEINNEIADLNLSGKNKD